MWHVYVIKCIDGSLYTGSSNNLKKRLLDHKEGKGGRYTRSHKVLKIVYSEKLPTKSEALRREAEIKSWERARKIRILKLF
ncbi:MAG: GIY-YIG nuclease family protein [Patescibacteria group bacterium]